MAQEDPQGPANGATAAAARRSPSPAAAAAVANGPGPEPDDTEGGGRPGGEPCGPANGEAGHPLETSSARGDGAPKEVSRGEAPAVVSEGGSRGVNGAAAPRPSPASEPPRGAAAPPPPAIPATSLALKPPFSCSPREAWVPSWSRGRAPKASASELKSWVALLLTLDGRDKATKVLQYACRTLSWWLLSLATASSPSSSFSWTRLLSLGGPERRAACRQACLNHSARFAELKAALTQGRKAFRLGRTLIELHRLFELLSAGSEISFSAASLRKQLGGLLGLSSCCREEEAKSRACNSIGPPPARSPPAPWIDTVCAAAKLLGLAGFWAADNASYLAQCGLFDDYRRHATAGRRGEARNRRASQFSSWANRSYFVGALAGLVGSLRACARHRSLAIMPLLCEEAADTAKATDPSNESDSADPPRDADRGALLDRALEKQFGNLVALAKSCCDVLVFSNNPGVDLWRRGRRGAPMHEGFHCLCGLVSASAVLYNNFPNSNGSSAGPSKK